MTSKDNIEKIFKDKLGFAEEKPSKDVWRRINRRMFLKRFLKYKPLSLNIFNVVIITALGAGIIFSVGKNPDNNNTEKNSLLISDTGNKNIQEKITIPEKEIKTIKNDTKKSISIKTEKEIKIIKPEKEIKKVGLRNDKVFTGNKKNNTFSKSNNEENRKNVKLADKQPHCKFTADTESACEPAAISFINLSENGDSYLWDFGNGKTSNQKNPTFVFESAGEYKVTLTVTSGDISDSETKIITVYPKPRTSFEISGKTKNYYTGEEVIFKNNSSSYSKCVWNFGDGNSSSFINANHIYEDEGLYNVSLVCINKFNCSDTAFTNNLLIQDAKYKIRFPTAFSPDKSGQTGGYWKNNPYPNTVFYPVTEEDNIIDYKLRIYNKYGNLIFESNDINIGWNGFYNDMPAPSDVYVWECSGKFDDGKIFKETGNVTLLYLKNR